jgi:hypothetical protein
MTKKQSKAVKVKGVNSPYRHGKVNKKFWDEILIGKSIQKLYWSKGSLIGFKLDDGTAVDIVVIGSPYLSIEADLLDE